MPIWKYSTKGLNQEEVDNAIRALRAVCFRCGKEAHSNECTIRKLIVEIEALKQVYP